LTPFHTAIKSFSIQSTRRRGGGGAAAQAERRLAAGFSPAQRSVQAGAQTANSYQYQFNGATGVSDYSAKRLAKLWNRGKIADKSPRRSWAETHIGNIS